jgi:protein-disulfide isomerase
VAVAAAHALWSLFQWSQLILARRGGDHFCGLGEPGSCATVWDLPLASLIQDGTGLPVAGWGLVWSAVAFALPLWALVRRARGQKLEPIWSATWLTVLAGIASILVLAGASVAAGVFCTTCVITYALVLAYAAVCLGASDTLWPAQIPGGAMVAVGATLVAFLALLYPGLRTPQGSAASESAFLEAAQSAIDAEEQPVETRESPVAEEEPPIETAKNATEAAKSVTETAKNATEADEMPVEVSEAPAEASEAPVEVSEAPVEVEEKPVQVAKKSIEAEEEPVQAATRSIEAEEEPVQVAKRSVEIEEEPIEIEKRADAAKLEELIARLSPELRQGLSDALAAYSRSDRIPLRPARLLIGSSAARVRVTEFTDVLCTHCATLHETIAVLRQMLPVGSFALEPRQFPLDSECNPAVQMSSGDGVRCLAAQAMICLEKDWLRFADALFENQRWLTTKKIYDFASPFMARERLEACVSSPKTRAKLREDIAWAMQHDIQGTPLVLVNGREVPPFVQILYALILAEADPEHPAFAVLPPPQPQARLP